MTTYNLRREYVINRLRSYEERLGLAPLTPERSLFLALLVAAYAAGAGKIKSSQVRRWVEDRIVEIERPLLNYTRPSPPARPIVESRHMMGAEAAVRALRAVGAEVEGLPVLNVLAEWLLRAEAGGLREMMLEAALHEAHGAHR